MAHLQIVVSNDAANNRTKETVYITDIEEQQLFLSISTLKRLNSVPDNFPRPMPGTLHDYSIPLGCWTCHHTQSKRF